jgi:hypothetical protein
LIIPGQVQSSERKCLIKSIMGEIKVQRSKSAKWIKARPNMPLKEKDAVRTFVETQAVLETSEGSSVILMPRQFNQLGYGI